MYKDQGKQRVQRDGASHRGQGDLWLPALIAIVGWALSLTTWWILVQERRREILQSTAESASDVQELVAGQAESYRSALDDLVHDRARAAAGPRVELEALLGEVLRAASPGYALRIRWGDEEIFSRGEPSVDPWQKWWRVERRVELPYGVVWRLVLRPTRELAAARLTPIPHYLLASGIAISLLLAGLAHQLRVTRRQSRVLAASNRALAQRGGELEWRVAERTRELEEVVAELRAFNQTVSHDLRSPIGAVLNFAAILEEDYRGRPLDEEGWQILARIRRSAHRATRLLEGLLELSRAGRATLRADPIDMRRLAVETFAQVRVAEDDADVEFVVEDLPQVEGGRALLGDVLSNLFTNALKYSRGRERRRVVVRGAVDGEECSFEVADNGVGFDMRYKDKLFGLFERLDTGGDVEGTGVGLAIVERIVKRHGGRVWAEARPGEGARFFFSLPRTQASRS